jgi:adenylate cyclase class IV
MKIAPRSSFLPKNPQRTFEYACGFSESPGLRDASIFIPFLVHFHNVISIETNLRVISMFEVEKRFSLTEEQKKRFLVDAFSIGVKKFTDVYYDQEGSYPLTSKAMWLRRRDAQWELKVSLSTTAEHVRRSREIEDERGIADYLNMPCDQKVPFEAFLKENGYTPFCTCVTTRERYQKGDFSVDVDFVEYDSDFTYQMVEIELLVDDEAEISVASEKIIQLARETGFSLEPVRGKVIEYLARKRRDHYDFLVRHGVIQEK